MEPIDLFVAPFGLEATLRFARAAAELDGVRLALIGQEPAERLPDELRRRLAGHWRVDDALDPAALVAAARALGERLGPPRSINGVLEHLQVPLAQARAELGLPGMDVETARNFRDKARMKTVLAAAGLPCARHRLVVETGEALRFAAEVGFPLVVKPPAGAGARATFRATGREELIRALAASPPSPAGPVLVEEMVTGQERSFDSVVRGGALEWLSVSHYLPTPLEVLENPWIQWCVLLPREIPAPDLEMRGTAFAALRALGLSTGLTHMEWFRRADGSVVLSEVAARPPGAQITSLISWAHDADFYRAWAALMVRGEFTAPERRFAVGAAYLRGQGRGRQVVEVRGREEVDDLGGMVVEARWPNPGQPASEGYEGLGHVIVRDPDTDRVREALARIVGSVRVVLG